MAQFFQENSRAQQAIESARNSSDTVVLVLTYIFFVVSSGGYFLWSSMAALIESLGKNPQRLESAAEFGDGFVIFIGLIFAVVFYAIWFFITLGLGMIFIRIYRHQILGNSLLVRYSDYAWLRDWTNQLAAELNMPDVEVYITQNPYINAYAFGFAKPYCIVLNSGTIRYMTDDEIKVIVIHEMAHIKYKHTNMNVFLQPFKVLPIVRAFSAWLAGFWSRRAELTADRLAIFYLQNPDIIKKSLIKVHVGPDAAKYLNQTAEQWLDFNTRGAMNAFSQTFSDHPFLVRRLKHIDSFYPNQPEAQN
ncbi:hypothetical protein CR956_01660 [Candidatus Saccharibacteria bacterium]|nr:MAG: hypothetical protein CR956_01660 [Candidatus Saccharibacteria bacterium]